MTALCSFMMSIANYSYLMQGNKRIKLDQAFNIKQLSTTGMFTAILFGGLGVALYILGGQGPAGPAYPDGHAPGPDRGL